MVIIGPVILLIISNLYNYIELEKEPIPVVDFPAYVRKMHNNNDYLFSEEYAVRKTMKSSIINNCVPFT